MASNAVSRVREVLTVVALAGVLLWAVGGSDPGEPLEREEAEAALAVIGAEPRAGGSEHAWVLVEADPVVEAGKDPDDAEARAVTRAVGSDDAEEAWCGRYDVFGRGSAAPATDSASRCVWLRRDWVRSPDYGGDPASYQVSEDSGPLDPSTLPEGAILPAWYDDRAALDEA